MWAKNLSFSSPKDARQSGHLNMLSIHENDAALSKSILKKLWILCSCFNKLSFLLYFLSQCAHSKLSVLFSECSLLCLSKDLICVNTFEHKEHTNSGFVADLFAEFLFLLWLLQTCLKQPLLSWNTLKQRTHVLSNFSPFSLFCFLLILYSSAFSLIAFLRDS